jgi:hypothetical protein
MREWYVEEKEGCSKVRAERIVLGVKIWELGFRPVAGDGDAAFVSKPGSHESGSGWEAGSKYPKG